MANFAKIGLNNIVIGLVHVDTRDILDENCVEQEQLGVDLLKRITGHETWIQYSFNTRGGKHYSNNTIEDSKTPFRLNAPSIGWSYNADVDGFIQPKPLDYPSWILNLSTGLWEAPIPMPTDGRKYGWNEQTISWELKK